MPYQPIIFPPRPMMPDQDRAEHQRARASILDEDFDEVLDLWLRDYVAPEVLVASLVDDADPAAGDGEVQAGQGDEGLEIR